MGGACSTCGGEGRGIQGFGGNLRERDHGPGVDGRIILRWIFRKWDVGGLEWIDLAQDRDRCGHL
jgi:hypothetical protein